MWAKGVVLTPWPSGRLVGAEDLTVRADCYLIHTPDLRPVSVCVRVRAWRERDREGLSTRNVTDIKRGGFVRPFNTTLHICQPSGKWVEK